MNSKNELIKNTALLTGASLFMRFSGMIWQVWLAGRIGETGMGLFQLVLSVSSLAGTLAISGIRFTTTRLISEEFGHRRIHGARIALRKCLIYATVFGFLSFFLLQQLAEPIAFFWLGDARTVSPLRWLSAGLPCLALSAVIYGYFTATGRVWKSVAVQIGREGLMIALTVWLLRDYERGNIETACRSICAGGTIADWIGLILLFNVLLFDLRKFLRSEDKQPSYNMTDRMLSLSLPLAAASYARSGLSTLQHLLVPKGLKHSGLTASQALAGYGVIQGMSLPVVLFPSCVMMAVSELIVPKLTRAQAENDPDSIRKSSRSVLRRSLMFSLFTASILLFLGDSIGNALYGSPEAGRFIRIFSLIVPIMYMDMITDGCLKGLGEMMFCMAVNIADAGLSALLVFLLLPKWGLNAYIAVICFTEIFNFILSFERLKHVAGLKSDYATFAFFTASALLAGAAAWALNVKISAGSSVPALIISMIFGVILYACLINQISPEEAAGRRASGRRSHRCW